MDIFNQLIGDNNPFDGIDLGFQAVPTLVDIDGDGDLDAIVGENDGILNFFENVGDASNPSFIERTGADSPVNDIGDLGSDSIPNFVDIDGDGDLDAFIGLQENNVSFFENVGDASNPSFIQRTGVDNPLDLVNVADDAAPTFVDIDGDGDLDVILGEGEGTLLFFENVGDVNTPTFEERIGVDNPLDGVDVGIDAIPTTADFDGDGDFDVIVGDSTGSLSFFENTGDASNPSFTERVGTANPLDGINVDRQSAPTFVDIDGDSDLDIIIGDRNGQIQTFLNADDPFDGFDLGADSDPTFIDIDNDGDLDLFVGEGAGNINFFENVGDLNTPRFVEKVGSNNPFDSVDVGNDSSLAFIDIDRDGDLDAIVGENGGILNFFENTGDANNASFIEITGLENPFDGVDVGGDSAPNFVDIDGDGDLDAIVGENDGNLNFFENTGDLNSPVFTEQTGTDNPFNGIDVGIDSHIAFIDKDGDGDLDAVVGDDTDDDLNFFENTGDVNNPIFTERIGLENPFNGIELDGDPVPAFSDIDGDGDQDLLLGANNGTLNFFENTGPLETEINLVDTSLTITDINGGNSPDTLTLTETETTLLIEDPNQAFQVSDGVALNDFNSAEVPLDSITGPVAINTLAGNDSITANTTLALNVNTGAGDDTIIGGSGRDTVFGSSGNDSISGGDGNDSILGGNGADTLNGGQGADVLNGGGGSDLLLGLGNNDTINGSNGNDTVNAGGGNDVIFGANDRDFLNGSAGDDVVNGGGDRDILVGSRGNDLLVGGEGLDILNGADNVSFGVNERDTLVGGRGTQDRFKLGDARGAYYLDEGAGGTSSARILDFESLDRIILSGSIGDYRIATQGGDSFILKRELGADDTVGIVENTVGLNLDSVQFIFV